jgi:hypothetical protein
MAQILVRKIDAAAVARLKKRAREQGRSLESEAREILEQAARVNTDTALKLVGRLRTRFRGRRFEDSARLIREDRDR